MNSNSFFPTTFDDVIISDETSRKKLYRIVHGKARYPFMGQNGICLWGMYGTGKTTLACLLPEWMEKSAQLAKSSRGTHFTSNGFWHYTDCRYGNNSVQMAKDMAARCEAPNAFSRSGWNYEIVDEIDVLTSQAQSALKALMTKADSSIFVYTTNHLSKLDPGLIDRCVLIEMNQPEPQSLLPLGRRIIAEMGITETEEIDSKIMQAAKDSKGSIRRFGESLSDLALADLQV